MVDTTITGGETSSYFLAQTWFASRPCSLNRLIGGRIEVKLEVRSPAAGSSPPLWHGPPRSRSLTDVKVILAVDAGKLDRED